MCICFFSFKYSSRITQTSIRINAIMWLFFSFLNGITIQHAFVVVVVGGAADAAVIVIIDSIVTENGVITS